jgi:hypothetical protein
MMPVAATVTDSDRRTHWPHWAAVPVCNWRHASEHAGPRLGPPGPAGPPACRRRAVESDRRTARALGAEPGPGLQLYRHGIQVSRAGSLSHGHGSKFKPECHGHESSHWQRSQADSDGPSPSHRRSHHGRGQKSPGPPWHDPTLAAARGGCGRRAVASVSPALQACQ